MPLPPAAGQGDSFRVLLLVFLFRFISTFDLVFVLVLVENFDTDCVCSTGSEGVSAGSGRDFKPLSTENISSAMGIVCALLFSATDKWRFGVKELAIMGKKPKGTCNENATVYLCFQIGFLFNFIYIYICIFSSLPLALFVLYNHIYVSNRFVFA